MSELLFQGAGNGRIWTAGTGSAHPNTFAVAALKADGSVVTWGTQGSGGSQGVYSLSQFTGTTLIADVSDQLQEGVAALYSTSSAFAALKEDGSVVTWGNQSLGGDSSAVVEALESGVTAIFSAQNAFAALKEDGSVVTWGLGGQGGNSGGVAEALTGGVVTIHSTQTAFAAIKADGSVVTWGQAAWGGDSSAVAEDLAGGVVTVASTERAFAALKADGSVITWGVADYGGDSSALADELSGGVSALYSTGRAFAALKEDGSVVAWGQSATYGADTSAVDDDLSGGVVDIYNTNTAFAAVKEDGSVVTWGWASGGGNSAAVAEVLSEGVVTMVSTPQAFAALMEDGTVIVWGGSQAANTGAAAEALSAGNVIGLYANQAAFAALREDGSVITWGSQSDGGNSSAIAEDLAGGVVAVYPGFWSFSALKEDGSVVTWGNAGRGGDSSAVADDLAAGVVDIATPLPVEQLDPDAFISAPDAPVIDAVAGDDVISPDEAAEGLTITGTAEPEVTVSATLDGATQTVTAGADGTWSATFPPEDIPEAGAYTITAQASRQGLTSPLAERAVTVITAPDAPVIDTVAGDDVIDPDAAAEGITVTGTAAPGATVAVSFAEATQTATADADGTWSATFPPEDIPETGDYTITAQATLNGLTGPGAERSVAVVTAPDAPVIDTVAGDDVIEPDEAAEGITITGTATPGATVAVSFAEATQTATADADGAWSVGFGPDDIPEDGDYTVTAQATVNGLTGPSAERSVTVEPLPDLIDLDAGIKGPGDGTVWTGGSGIAFANERAFAALKEDGSVVTWGAPGYGGDSSAVADDLQSGVVSIMPARNAFAALKEDGSVVTWGADWAANSSGVAEDLASGVTALFSGRNAFAALKEDGSVVFWGGGADLTHDTAFVNVADQLQGDVATIRTAQFGFAAIKQDGSVVTWGNFTWHPASFQGRFGDDTSAVADALQEGVTAVYSTGGQLGWALGSAFAALKQDGSVVTWGFDNVGGDSSAVADDLAGGVVEIHPTTRAFAALKEDGLVITWGDEGYGGDSSAVADALQGDVVGLHATLRAFAALKADGSVVTWGDANAGGDSSAVADALQEDVVALYSTRYAFAALKADGSVVAWRQSHDHAFTENWGDDTGPVADQLEDGVVQIFSTAGAFAALKEDGSVVTWGVGGWGGNSSLVSEDLSSGVVTIYATQYAFAAVKEDGSVVSWGNDAWGVGGGDSSAVADQLSGGVVALSAPFPVEPLDPASFADPPAAPVIGAVAGDDVIDVTEAAEGITVTGTAEPGASVSVRLSDILAASAIADDTGNWQVVFTPESQLDLGAHTIFATATVGGLSSAVASRDVTVVAPPLALVIDRVAGNNVITPDEAAEGLAITGSAAPGAEVAVTFGDFAQTTVVSPDGTWRVELAPQQIPEPGDHFVLARATLDGTASPLVGRRVSVVEPPSAPEIFPVGVDDVIAPGELDFGLDMRGLADPGARVTVSFGDITQTVIATAEGMVTGGWEVLFDLEDLPPAGEHMVTAQAARDGLFSDVTERLVTIENTPAQIFGDTTGQVIDGDPTAEQDRGTLLVIDRDPGEDRFQTPDPQDLDTPFGAFQFDPLTGNWLFALDNDSPAVRVLSAEDRATASLSVSSQDGSATETITVSIQGAGEPEAALLEGLVLDRAGAPLDGSTVVFSGADDPDISAPVAEDGGFRLALELGASGQLDAARPHDRSMDGAVSARDALEVLRLAVGLDPSWGPAHPLDFIAADITQSGRISAQDALEVLRAAVGLQSDHAPRWVFLDAEADLSGIDQTNTRIETGIRIDALEAGATEVSMTGLLLGNMQDFA